MLDARKQRREKVHRYRGQRAALRAAVSLAASLTLAHAQPVFDGTTGGQSAGTVVVDTIDVSQGTRVGGNVFNSFSSFSIDPGTTITFTDDNPTTAVNIIINRVTGTDISEIYGTLRSTVDGADFYLINPNGIVMGPGSIVDVPSSFYLSTADELRFGSGEVLRANIGSSSFTSATPTAFGFVDASVGDIAVVEGQIVGKPGADIALVGGNVSLLNGPDDNDQMTSIETRGGDIDIVAVSGIANVPIGSDAASLVVNSYGDIVISAAGPDILRYYQRVVNSPDRDAGISPFRVLATAADSHPGNLTLRGRNISIYAADIGTLTTGSTAGGNVFVHATDDVVVQELAQLFASTHGTGRSGEVHISAKNVRNLSDDNSSLYRGAGFIGTSSFGGGGDAADVVITATDTIEAYACCGSPGSTRGSIGSHALNSEAAAAGSIRLSGKTLKLNNTHVQSNTAFSSPNPRGSGSIDLQFSESVRLERGGSVRSVSEGTTGDIFIRTDLLDVNVGGITTQGAGAKSGDIVIRANQVNLIRGNNFSEISTLNLGNGDGGLVDIEAALVRLFGGYLTTNSRAGFTNATSGTAKSGDILIKAEELVANGSSQIQTVGQDFSAAGDIHLNVTAITLSETSLVSSLSMGVGRAGNIFVEGNALKISGGGSDQFSGFSADSGCMGACGSSSQYGDAGNISISVKTVEITNGGRLSAVAYGAGNAGTIIVCCSDSFSVSGPRSQVVAGTAAGSTGDAGRVLISAKDVTLRDGGRMTVATAGSGLGGEILVRAHTFTAEDPARVVQGRTDAEAAGLATVSGTAGAIGASSGRIAIEAGVFNLLNGAVITTDTFGTVPAGSISLRASKLNITGEQALVSSRAIGDSGGDAGNIDIGTVDFTISDGASFSTLAHSGGGGNIKFAWNGMGRINNASVTTDVLGGAGGGGTIEFGVSPVALLDFDTLFEAICGELATSFAIYDGLKSYDPESTRPPILQLSNAYISASAQEGSGGIVVIDSGTLVISSIDLPSDFDVSSVTGPDGSVIAPAPFTPPPVIIVPERNVASRCQVGHRPSALADNLTGSMAVGADPSALLPVGPTDAERTLEAAVTRLCGA